MSESVSPEAGRARESLSGESVSGVDLAVPMENLVSISDRGGQFSIPPSRMFDIRDALEDFSQTHPKRCVYDLSQGDGGASLPGVSGELFERALWLQKEKGSAYTPPLGCEEFREAVADSYWNLDPAMGWDLENVVACDGGRDALSKAFTAMQLLQGGRRGDFLLVSAVPWISYKWASYAVGANALMAPGDARDGWRLTAEGVEVAADQARHLGGRRIAGMVITSPDNPTGRLSSIREQAEIAAFALEYGVGFVIFDWIYHQVMDEPPFSINELLDELEPSHRRRCMVLDGITKSLGASNVRGAHLMADRAVVQVIKARASHSVIPGYFAQALTMAAIEKGRAAFDAINLPTSESRKIVRRFLKDRALQHIIGQGYYAFINVEEWLSRGRHGDSAQLGEWLARQHGVAVVPGIYFSRAGANWIRLSYALPPETTQAALVRLWDALEQI
jgi:aspartate/methionine/tyrosine aminotransferase